MVFHTFDFFKFFIIIYFASFFLNLTAKRSESNALPFQLNKLFLLGASYYFYAYWDVRFLSLVVISTLADYWAGRRIFQAASQSEMRPYLIFSLAVNLSILGFFKYFNFFIDSANTLLGGMGFNLPILNIILPTGVSFYTFQSLSYSLDIYFRKLEPSRNLVDFSLYVAFFPQLVAGPIVRARHFLPQLKQPTFYTADNFIKGFQIFLYGLFLKVVLADNIAPIVDPIFKNPESYDNLAIWVAVLGYAVQIFCDFCGYSEMAIGLALSMGYELPINFRTPYLANSLFDFWRRWHISLSSWLRDYLYIPLGGNRKGFKRTCFNVFITMLLGGLWHGPNWRFLLWGAWHGLGLLINRGFEKMLGERLPDSSLISIGKWALTFSFVCLGWVLFRAESLELVGVIYAKLLFLDGGILNWKFLTAKNLFFIPCMILIHLWFVLSKKESLYFRNGSFACHFYIVLVIFMVFLYAPLDYQEFIYFQF